MEFSSSAGKNSRIGRWGGHGLEVSKKIRERKEQIKRRGVTNSKGGGGTPKGTGCKTKNISNHAGQRGEVAFVEDLEWKKRGLEELGKVPDWGAAAGGSTCFRDSV